MPTSTHLYDLDPPPWSRVHRIQLIRREIREFLPESALEILFSRGRVVVEGGPERRKDGPEPASAGSARGRAGDYFGTVMVTVDLSTEGAVFSEPADEATARRLAELMETDDRVREKLVELLRARLAVTIGCSPSSLRIALVHAVRVEGCKVFLDGDAVVSLAGAAGVRR